MSALTDLFTAMANKIRSKTGTQTLYTPAQMVSDGIDDVYDAGYAAGGGGGVTPTSITPSDSSPVAMTANNAYEPTTNGYAIASNPTTLTPSDASPQSIASGTIYKGSGSGYAIGSYSGITPSAGGTYFSSGMKKMSSSGYAYPSRATSNYLTGTDSATASSSSQPGTIFTYRPSTDGIYLIVVSAMTNVSNGEGYIRINSNMGAGPKDYIPTHGTGSSVNSVKSAYKVFNSYISEMSVQLGWDGSHSSCWFKYSINIFKIE